MALIDVHCAACDRVEEVYRHNTDWPSTPKCSKCEGETVQIHLPSYLKASAVDPVVVYQAPDGSFRFPPATDSLSTAAYDKQGLTRIELRGSAQVRKFEKVWTAAEMSQVRRRIERQQEAFEAGEKARRSEIRRGLEQGFQIPEVDPKTGTWTGRMQNVRLSDRGRAMMQAAMALNDHKGGPRVHESGCYVEAYSVDRSNRDRDPHRRNQ